MPEIAFPFTIILGDGSTQPVASEEDLDAVFEACFGEGWDEEDWDEEEEWDEEEWDEECFTFVFPLQVDLPGIGVQTANSEEELEDLVDDWFDNNELDSINFPTLVFPVTVDFGEGEIQVINSEEELDELLDECYGDDFDECFEVNYPIDIQLPDGATITVSDEDALEELLDLWDETNPDAELLPVFPITVTLHDGTIETINSEDDLDAIFENCYGEEWDDCGGLIMSNHNQATTRAVMQRTENAKVSTKRIRGKINLSCKFWSCMPRPN